MLGASAFGALIFLGKSDQDSGKLGLFCALFYQETDKHLTDYRSVAIIGENAADRKAARMTDTAPTERCIHEIMHL